MPVGSYIAVMFHTNIFYLRVASRWVKLRGLIPHRIFICLERFRPDYEKLKLS